MNGNLKLNGWPVTPKALLADPPEEVIREVALSPTLKRVKEATVRLAQIKRERDLKQTNLIAAENQQTDWKAVDGLGELKARIPFSVFFEMKRRCGDRYWEHEENMTEFLKNNPQYRVKISRGTRGQQYVK